LLAAQRVSFIGSDAKVLLDGGGCGDLRPQRAALLLKHRIFVAQHCMYKVVPTVPALDWEATKVQSRALRAAPMNRENWRVCAHAIANFRWTLGK